METLRGTVKDLRARMMRPEVQVPLSERIDKLPKWRKDWLEVWGNQWAAPRFTAEEKHITPEERAALDAALNPFR